MKQDLPVSKNVILWSLVAILVTAGVITMVFAFNNGDENSASELELVYTRAAETLAAQQATLQAAVPSATPTQLSTATATFTPLASPTTFGQLFPTATVGVPASGGCDNSVYVSDVTIPDGTVIAPGQAFTKTWKVSNTGTCTWSATYQIILISGEAMGGKATAIGFTVAPGQSGDISVALTAPATASASNITGIWRLSNASGQPFGTTLTVVIKVGSSTTGTATATNSGGATSAASTSTNTVAAPSQTPTTAPPTNTPETPSGG